MYIEVTRVICFQLLGVNKNEYEKNFINRKYNYYTYY